MASVDKVLPKNGAKRFRGCGCESHDLTRWRDPNGKPRKKSFCPKKRGGTRAAKREAVTVEANKWDRNYFDDSDRTTVAEAAWEWVKDRPVRPRSRRAYEAFVRNHIEPTRLGSIPRPKVRPEHVQAWVTDQGRVPSTVRWRVGILRSMFNTWLQDGKLRADLGNPVHKGRGLRLPPLNKRKIVPPSVEQVIAWAEAMGEVEPRYEAIVLLQAMVGPRIGEALALRVDDLNWLATTTIAPAIRIDRQLDDRMLEWAPLKTANSYRMIPVSPEVPEMFARHMAAFPPGADGSVFTLPPSPTDRRGRINPGRSRRAAAPGRVNHRRYEEALRRAARKAGLPEHFTSHWLRHHYASVLLQQGLSVFEVADRLGDTPEMVLKVYGHCMPSSEDRTRQAISAAWAAARAGRGGTEMAQQAEF